jgi:hypothetical protein
MKLSGKRSAGNSHAAFDEAGDGNGDKETTAPLLDPTRKIIQNLFYIIWRTILSNA